LGVALFIAYRLSNGSADCWRTQLVNLLPESLNQTLDGECGRGGPKVRLLLGIAFAARGPLGKALVSSVVSEAVRLERR
jgi:hypothetical protein